MFFVPNGLRGAAAALLVCAACATSGQVSFVHMEHIAADNGFPSHVVWKCVSDPMGFMWFATEEGLHRWDGVEYLSFRSDITDTSAFEGRTFFDLVLDRAGFLWTITRNTLVRIDPKTFEIRKWEHRPAGFKTNSKNVQRIIRICSDKKDRLWVGTTYGFFVLDEMKKPLRYIEVPAADNEDFGNVTGMTMDDDGNLWSTSLSGVTRIDGRDFSLRHYKLDGDIPGGAITFWQGTIWVGAEKLYSYDKTNDGFVVSGPEGYGGIVPYQFESSHPAGDTLWIAFRGSGLASYVRSENKFIRWSADAKRQSTLPSFVFSIFRKDDCLWLCSGDGVFRFFPQRQSFRRIGVNEIAAEEDMTIYNLFPDTYAAEEGWLYISASTGLYHWNHITGTTESIPWPLKEDGSMLKYPNFFSIDSQGNWWWSMGYEGVYKCNEGKAELILSDEEVEPGTRDYLWYMSTVDEDSKGRIWIAAESKLACYEEGKISMFTPQPVISAAGDTLMPKPSFGSFVFDRDENIWLVSDFSYQKHVIALVRFNVETKAFDYFYHDGNSNFPNVDNIHQVSVVGDNIWCAAEGGVLYFKPTATGSPEFHVVGYNAGMNSLHCQGIKGDSAGNVWVSGFGGIFSVSPSGKLTKYGVSDGLIRQKLPVHFVGLKDGTLLFHTTWEITAFDPVGLWP
ncbi:MAG: hypothetical protein JNM00_02780 [Flavobacteriales bacterium]|nr:hypothetical protein [Flavobacteriales bacterium]